MDPQTTLQISPDVAFRPLGEGESAVLVETRSGQLFTCNETTTAFLRAMDGRRTLDAIVDQLHGIFDVERDVLEKDIAEIAAELVTSGLVRPVEKHD